ncbi:hypothetical protein IAT38_008463 [Cryptococcus sp. DSM 104549]
MSVQDRPRASNGHFKWTHELIDTLLAIVAEDKTRLSIILRQSPPPPAASPLPTRADVLFNITTELLNRTSSNREWAEERVRGGYMKVEPGGQLRRGRRWDSSYICPVESKLRTLEDRMYVVESGEVSVAVAAAAVRVERSGLAIGDIGVQCVNGNAVVQSTSSDTTSSAAPSLLAPSPLTLGNSPNIPPQIPERCPPSTPTIPVYSTRNLSGDPGDAEDELDRAAVEEELLPESPTHTPRIPLPVSVQVCLPSSHEHRQYGAVGGLHGVRGECGDAVRDWKGQMRDEGRGVGRGGRQVAKADDDSEAEDFSGSSSSSSSGDDPDDSSYAGSCDSDDSDNAHNGPYKSLRPSTRSTSAGHPRWRSHLLTPRVPRAHAPSPDPLVPSPSRQPNFFGSPPASGLSRAGLAVEELAEQPANCVADVGRAQSARGRGFRLQQPGVDQNAPRNALRPYFVDPSPAHARRPRRLPSPSPSPSCNNSSQESDPQRSVPSRSPAPLPPLVSPIPLPTLQLSGMPALPGVSSPISSGAARAANPSPSSTSGQAVASTSSAQSTSANRERLAPPKRRARRRHSPIPAHAFYGLPDPAMPPPVLQVPPPPPPVDPASPITAEHAKLFSKLLKELEQEQAQERREIALRLRPAPVQNRSYQPCPEAMGRESARQRERMRRQTEVQNGGLRSSAGAGSGAGGSRGTPSGSGSAQVGVLVRGGASSSSATGSGKQQLPQPRPYPSTSTSTFLPLSASHPSNSTSAIPPVSSHRVNFAAGPSSAPVLAPISLSPTPLHNPGSRTSASSVSPFPGPSALATMAEPAERVLDIAAGFICPLPGRPAHGLTAVVAKEKKGEVVSGIVAEPRGAGQGVPGLKLGQQQGASTTASAPPHPLQSYDIATDRLASAAAAQPPAPSAPATAEMATSLSSPAQHLPPPAATPSPQSSPSYPSAPTCLTAAHASVAQPAAARLPTITLASCCESDRSTVAVNQLAVSASQGQLAVSDSQGQVEEAQADVSGGGGAVVVKQSKDNEREIAAKGESGNARATGAHFGALEASASHRKPTEPNDTTSWVQAGGKKKKSPQAREKKRLRKERKRLELEECARKAARAAQQEKPQAEKLLMSASSIAGADSSTLTGNQSSLSVIPPTSKQGDGRVPGQKGAGKRKKRRASTVEVLATKGCGTGGVGKLSEKKRRKPRHKSKNKEKRSEDVLSGEHIATPRLSHAPPITPSHRPLSAKPTSPACSPAPAPSSSLLSSQSLLPPSTAVSQSPPGNAFPHASAEAALCHDAPSASKSKGQRGLKSKRKREDGSAQGRAGVGGSDNAAVQFSVGDEEERKRKKQKAQKTEKQGKEEGKNQGNDEKKGKKKKEKKVKKKEMKEERKEKKERRAQVAVSVIQK